MTVPKIASKQGSVSDMLTAGTRVKITQQIPQRDEDWVTTITGTVLKAEQDKTGSWFAHSKDDRLWLDRLTLRLDDGEITELILDKYTRVEVV